MSPMMHTFPFERRDAVAAARQAALEPYTDAPESTDDWLDAVVIGADAAMRVLMERLIDRAKTHGDAAAIEAMYEAEAKLATSDSPEARS